MKSIKKVILFVVLLFGILQSYKFILGYCFDIHEASETHLEYEKTSFFEVGVVGHDKSNLDSIVIPHKVMIKYSIYNVTKICSNAFREYKIGSLSKLKLPSSVTEIEYGAFAECENLKCVEIHSGITNICGNPFAGCRRLTEIVVSRENPVYTSFYGVLYNKDKTKILCVPAGLEGTFEIPPCVKEIGTKAFSGCSDLTEVTIPSEVTVIRSGAFENCENLKKMELPMRVSVIESSAFSGCKSLKYIYTIRCN